jgi:hypothetical protein
MARTRFTGNGVPTLGIPGALLLALLLGVAPVEAQLHSESRATTRDLPRVFLDCQTPRNCDDDHFRTEIRFVNWVRDRADSDVHVIFTSTGVGGDGMQYTLDFIGRGAASGLSDALTYTSAGTDVRTEVMDGLTHTLRIGLLRYAVQTGLGREFEIGFRGPEPGGESEGDGNTNGAESALYDPWNYWTFRFGLSGNLDLRETQKSSRINPSLNANRVTEDWKVQFSGFVNLRTDRRQLSDGSWLENDLNFYRVSGLVVRSVTPHVSMGVDVSAGNSLQNNQRMRVNLAPAIEYNYYPYEQANRRQMIAHYAIGGEYSSYHEQTVYGVTNEMLPQHRIGIQYRAREEWGNAGVGVSSAQYLHDTGLYSLNLSGDVSYRITRGLEVNLSGETSFVNDNIHTPLGGINDEDILLGRRALPSSYRHQGSLGFNYRWGSSFANIVNNRFPGSVR